MRRKWITVHVVTVSNLSGNLRLLIRLELGTLHDEQPGQDVNKDPLHPGRHLVGLWRPEVNVQHHHCYTYAEKKQNKLGQYLTQQVPTGRFRPRNMLKYSKYCRIMQIFLKLLKIHTFNPLQKKQAFCNFGVRKLIENTTCDSKKWRKKIFDQAIRQSKTELKPRHSHLRQSQFIWYKLTLLTIDYRGLRDTRCKTQRNILW